MMSLKISILCRFFTLDIGQFFSVISLMAFEPARFLVTLAECKQAYQWLSH